MSSKHAGVHLRCSDSAEILLKLKGLFDKKIKPSKGDLAAMELIRAFAASNIEAISDADERAEKEAILTKVMGQALVDGEPAVIVVRKHFVSIYWYDHIRPENLKKEAMEYSSLCGVPALGVSVYDGENFLICAVCSAGTPNVKACMGEYMFDYDDITPVKAEDICTIADAPFLLEALKETLSCTDGEKMAETFEKSTGLPVFMYAEDFEKAGKKPILNWKSAAVYAE